MVIGTTIKRGRYVDGFQPITGYGENDAVELGVGSGIAIARGDVVIVASSDGYADLATTLAVDSGLFVAMTENTAAEASADNIVQCTAIPICISNIRYMVPCTANAILAQASHVGGVYNLDGSEDGITVASAVSTYWGFRIEEIDISTEAVAVETYGYAIGRFVILGAAT